MKRKLVVWTSVMFLVLITSAGSFLCGFLCNEKKIVPHDFFVRSACNWSQQQAVFHHIYRLLGVVQPAPRVWHAVVMDPEGNIVDKLYMLEAFERSSYASFLDKMPTYGDLFHTSTIEVFDGSMAGVNPLFEKGRILIFVRGINTIAVVDMEEQRVIWALSGQWIEQHQPTLLDNRNILLFDNKGHKAMSKVIEIDPFQQEIVWANEGNPENGFLTKSCGSNQRLPNGSTLITQSNSGKASEVTSSNQIVWEFYNSARAGEDDELITTLFEVIRLNNNYPTDWLTASITVGKSNGQR